MIRTIQDINRLLAPNLLLVHIFARGSMPIYEVKICEACLPDPNEQFIFELEHARDVSRS
jgi:hypothetical protein